MRMILLAALAVAGWLLAAAPAIAAPVNDAFDQATPLGDAPVKIPGTNFAASRESGEPLSGLQTVWYAFRPTVSGHVAVEVAGAGFVERVLGVYTGPAVSALRAVGTSQGVEARVAFDAAAGETYRIVVARTYETGPFELRIRSMPLPANDAFDDAFRGRVPFVHAGNLADATTEVGERRASHSVWYRFRPRRTGTLTLDTTGTCALIRLYTGATVDELRRLDEGTSLSFRARRGRTYHAAVDCRDPGYGDYALRVSDGSVTGDGVVMAVEEGQTLETVRARGVRLSVSAARRVRVAIELRVSRSTARALGLSSRVLGRLEGRLRSGAPRPAAVRLTREAARALEDEPGLDASVRLELPRSSVPDRFATADVTL